MNEWRKLFEIGGSKAITIPQRWLDHNELRNGDTLELQLENDKIIIFKPKEPRISER